MKSSTERDELNIDLADFHGLSDKTEQNPYSPPKSNEGLFDYREYVKLGVWAHIANASLLLFYGFLIYIMGSIALEKGQQFSGFLDGTAILAIVLFLTHTLIYFKIEIARKIAVVHSYILLLGIPFGTIAGIILLKALKGKKFRKSKSQNA